MKIEAEDLISESGVTSLIVRPSLIYGNASKDAMAPRTYGIILDSVVNNKFLELDNEKKLNPTWNKDIFFAIDKWIKGEILESSLNISCREIVTKYEVAVSLARKLGYSDANILPTEGNPFESQIIDPRLSEQWLGDRSVSHMITEIAAEIPQSRNPETMRPGKERI